MAAFCFAAACAADPLPLGHSDPGTGNGLGWHLAGAALLFLCCCNSSVDSSQRDSDLWVMSPQWNSYIWKCLWPWESPHHSRYISKCLWPWLCRCHSRCTPEGAGPKDRSVLQQAHPDAPVAVHEALLERLRACGHG